MTTEPTCICLVDKQFILNPECPYTANFDNPIYKTNIDLTTPVEKARFLDKIAYMFAPNHLV